ncbi:MAG: ABC transporter permease [Oscillospiraceae bacterium]|nr:ABC transporter permease [Oscillospiraceae bacterium]
MTFGEKRFNKKLDKIRRLEESGVLAKKKKKSRAFNKFLSNKLAVFGTCLFIIILLACICAPLLTPYDPAAIDLMNMSKAPNAEHIFGTDKIGRDLFARCLYGGRTSILIAGAGSLGGAVIGVILGCFAGYKGGWFDKITMRASEIFMSFPQLILVLVMLTIMGQSMVNIIIIFICTGWSGVYRQARAAMLSIREEEYVQALHAFGLNDMIVCFKHMLPNALSPVIVNITINFATMILEEASLSFLGLGVPMEIPTWGNILNAAQDLHTLQNAWWIWLFAGIVISLFVMGVSFMGDGIRDTTDSSIQG